jgi:competence protein ComGC
MNLTLILIIIILVIAIAFFIYLKVSRNKITNLTVEKKILLAKGKSAKQKTIKSQEELDEAKNELNKVLNGRSAVDAVDDIFAD